MPTINVQALSNGAVAVDAFAPDFTNPAGTVFERDFWNRIDHRYLTANDDNEFTVITTADYRDVEVETWARRGEIFLALSADGRGLRVSWSEEVNTLSFRPLTNIANPPGPFAGEGTVMGDDFHDYAWNLTEFAGYNQSDANGRYYTFGISGIYFYVKMNGVEVARVVNPYQLVAGKIAFKGQFGAYGMSYITVTALSPVSLFSDPDNKIFDPRDYGFKDIPTTGSITSGTPTLTVADATGYEIGDPIIVEIGTESGLGLRGSAGVGGTWPSLSYANAAAMNADTTQVDGKWAYAIDTGLTKWWDDDASQAWSRSTNGTGDYYESLVVPIALVATITNIVGNVITLDTNASTTATNANVYYNCIDGLSFFTEIDDEWDTERTISIPAGDYAVNGLLELGDFSDWTWEFYGQGIDSTRLFSPDGAYCSGIAITNCGTISIHDLEVCGNFGSNGYHINHFGSTDEISRGTPNWDFNPGIAIISTAGTIYNVRSQEHSGPCFEGQFIGNVAWADCEAFRSEDPKRYLANWAYQVADSDASTEHSVSFTDCSFVSPEFTPGYEAFRSDGVAFIRCSSVNGMMSMNASGNLFIDECSFLMQEGNEPLNYTTAYGETVDATDTRDNPIIQANSNIHPPSASMILGGLIRNPTIVVEGFSNVALQHGYRGLIIINGDNPNISVTAVPPWPDRPCDAPLVNGFISGLDWVDGLEGLGALAVNTDAEGTIIDGLRVNGIARPDQGNFKNIFHADTIVRNCVFDGGVTGLIDLDNPEAVNNITPAEFLVICVDNIPPPTPEPLPEIPEMTGTLYGLPLSQQLDEDGDPHSGCLLYLYEALTSTPVDSFSDYSLTTLNAYPIQADASGRIPQFWLADGAYRARLTTEGGVEIFDEDLILTIGPSTATVSSGGGSSSSVDSAAVFSTGDLKWRAVTGTHTGWVRANGRTIGSSSSGGTERASSDTQSLYEFLWNSFSNTLCPVATGRGATALADFAANKAIGTLDMRGYGLYGLDDMGNSAAGRLVTGTPTTAASATGAEKTSITLAIANLPAHTHGPGDLTGDTSVDGAHTHEYENQSANNTRDNSGGTNVADDNEVTHNTSSDGNHSHSVEITDGETASTGSGTAYVATTISPGRLGTWLMKL